MHGAIGAAAEEPFDLRRARVDEVARVLDGARLRGGDVVGLLLVELDLAGDAVVLDADVAPDPVVVKEREDVLVRRVEAEVAVELAVGGSPG